MKPINNKPKTCTDFGTENNDKDPKFKVGNHIRISKYKITFSKGCDPNWNDEDFVIEIINILFCGYIIISDLNVEEIVGTFHKKELQKTNQTEFRTEKVIKGKGDKLYVEWKGYDNPFSSLIDKKRYCHIKWIISWTKCS